MSLEIVEGSSDSLDGVSEGCKGGVAGFADESSDDVVGVAVVNADVSGRVANLAPTVISGRKPLISSLRYSVANPKIRPPLSFRF